MRAGAAALVVAASLAARPGAADPLRVSVLIPAEPGARGAAALLSAELLSQGFVVDERPLRGPLPAALARARAAGAFATVIADGSRVAALVVVFRPDGDEQHAIDLGPAREDPDRPPPGLLAVLAVRVSELLRAQADDEDATVRGGAAGDRFRRPAAGGRTPESGSRVPEAGRTPDPGPPIRAGPRNPEPGSRVPAAGGRPPEPAAGRPRWEPRLAVTAVAALPSATIGPAGGAGLALSWRQPRGLCAGGRLEVLPLGRSLDAPGGSVRLTEALALLELGWERAGLLAPAAALALGAQLTAARGEASPGFQSHGDAAVTPAAALEAGLALRLRGRLALVAGTRLLLLWRPPDIWGDTAPIARVASVSLALWAGLRIGLR
jgi:hypothetical protein